MVFDFLGAVVDAVDEARDAENKEIGAEEADESGGGEDVGVEDDDTHYGATDTSEDPDETVGGVDGGAETDEDFEDAAGEGVDGDDDEVPSDGLVEGEEEKKGGSNINESNSNGDNPAGFLTGAMKGIEKFDDTEGKEKNSHEGDDGAEAVVGMEEGNPAKNNSENAAKGKNEPVTIDVAAIDMSHSKKSPC